MVIFLFVNTIIHIALGVLVTLACTFLMSLLLAIMVENEVVAVNSVPTYTIGIHTITVLIGSMLSASLEKGKIAVMAGAVAGCYLLVLLCINMLVFSEGFAGIGSGIFSAIAGALLTILIKGKFSGKKKHRIKMRSR